MFRIFYAYAVVAGGGEAKQEPDRSISLLQESFMKAFAEEPQENARTIPVTSMVNIHGEGSSNPDDSDEAMPPLSTTVEKFDDAMNRACSPTVRDSLFKNLSQSVSCFRLVHIWL